MRSAAFCGAWRPEETAFATPAKHRVKLAQYSAGQKSKGRVHLDPTNSQRRACYGEGITPEPPTLNGADC